MRCPEVLGVDRDRPLAIFIGALGDRRKGFDLLFEAWRHLCADPGWDANLLVVGVGAEVAAWRQRASERGLAQRITFLRFRSDIPRVLAAADVVVHPARYEAYGLGVHEALCRGLPAIVSRGAGVAERLPGDLQAADASGADAGRSDRSLPHLARRHLRMARARRALGATLRRRAWDDMAAEIAGIVEQVG